jgi:hypothetical protein
MGRNDVSFGVLAVTLGIAGISVLGKVRVVAEMGCLVKELSAGESIASPRLDPTSLPTLFCVSIPQGLS